GLMLQLIVHPVLWVERDARGQLLRVLGPDEPRAKAVRESWMHIEVDHLVDAQQREALHQGLVGVLADVRRAVSDWPAMQSRLRLAMQELAALASEKAGPAFVHELAETHAFLQWLLDDHFVLLGYRQHDLLRADDADTLRLVPGSDLGVLRASAKEQREGVVTALPPRARALARATTPLAVVTKANTRSKVHRPGYTDYIGVKRIDADGQVVGEHRFVGLFTSTAYSARVFEVPLVRGKVQAVMQRAAALGIATGGHLGKALTHILESFPRDELFQISPEMLQSMALEILRLGERQRLRLFVRPDPFDRYVSCLVFVPREAYSTELRRRFVGILMAAFDGASADFNVLLTDDVLARIQITVRTRYGQIPAYDRKALEQALAAAARRWDDELRDVLIERLGPEQGIPLARHWAGCFPTAYRERVSAREALHDVKKLAGLSAQRPLALSLYPMAGGEDHALGFKVYRWGAPVVLSESLPMLERMGACVFSENSYRIAVPGGPGDAHIWLHDFELRAQPTDAVPFEVLAQRFEQVFEAVYTGAVENDEFNRLALSAGLAVDEIVVLRAYAKYLKQMAFALSQSTIEAALSEHPAIARQLVALFKLRFDPQPQHGAAPLAGPEPVGAREAVAVKAIEAALDEVDVLSEDRALRQLLGLMLATVRTNFWCTGVGHSGADGPRRSFLSFKLDSTRVPELPEPRPRYEIFVYSPRFEGIHLRGGKVARGGLRWSDRPEDFRTEVLGLVKAQMVKNTIIVPVGSKGGFVLKRLPKNADRETVLSEGMACYQDYLRALLDVTDNRVGERVVTPPKVVRHDEPDPYLVVAADKGTASFSDQANAISAEYDFWLGDAFASGGSAGYDHKAMGITARGAWESVKRHFRELGIDTQSTDFTVAGIGDMSGDVFGNGMLLSRHIRLVAAFDHRHIFIDPNPDAAASFAQ
nr:NAD-glutamate dehydrogenase [Burkholderiaceae bacterium]